MKVLKSFITFLLIVLGVCLVCTTTVVVILKQQLSSTKIKETLKKTDMSPIVEKLEADENPVLEETEKILKTVGLPKSTIPDVLNSDGTKTFISNYLASAVDYVVENKDGVPITKEDLKKLLDDNINVIEKSLSKQNKEFGEEDKEVLYKYVDEYGDEVISAFPKPKEIIEQVEKQGVNVSNGVSLKQAINTLSTVLNTKTVILLIVGIILDIALIVVLNFKNHRWPKHLSIITFLYMIFLILVQIMFTIAKKLELFDMFGSFESMLLYIVNNVVNLLWIIIVVAFILFIAFIVVYNKIKIEPEENH